MGKSRSSDPNRHDETRRAGQQLKMDGLAAVRFETTLLVSPGNGPEARKQFPVSITTQQDGSYGDNQQQRREHIEW